MRLLTWIPIVVLLLLTGIAWVAFRTEHPVTLAFDEPPPAEVRADPMPPVGSETIAGRVVAEEDRPVRDALVETMHGSRVLWTHTDAEGRFRLPGVDPGPYRLTVVARGFLPARFEVEAGGASPAPLLLSRRVPPSPTVPAAVRSDLSVQLRSASGEGDLGRFELVLIPEERPVRDAPAFPRWATFASDGTCNVPDLVHGRYRAQVLPSWARGGSWPDLLTELDGPGDLLSHPSENGWDLELRSGEIRGRITDGTRRADRRVEFVAGALILVRPTPSGSPERQDPRIWPPAESDEQGAFLVRDLPPGHYLVTVHSGDRRIEREVTVYPAATTTLDL